MLQNLPTNNKTTLCQLRSSALCDLLICDSSCFKEGTLSWEGLELQFAQCYAEALSSPRTHTHSHTHMDTQGAGALLFMGFCMPYAPSGGSGGQAC